MKKLLLLTTLLMMMFSLPVMAEDGAASLCDEPRCGAECEQTEGGPAVTTDDAEVEQEG
tara:strand:- start:17196 stop:17372 length:177 start_codon:yes stop_codon:yes gene_type:complete